MDTSKKDIDLFIYNLVQDNTNINNIQTNYNELFVQLAQGKKELKNNRAVAKEKRIKRIRRAIVSITLLLTLIINAKGLAAGNEDEVIEENSYSFEQPIYVQKEQREKTVLIKDFEEIADSSILDTQDMSSNTVIMDETEDQNNEYYDNNESFETEIISEECNVNEQLSWILEKYNLTYDQFKVLNAVVNAEAKANSYNDAYAVINTLYNRTISSTWVNYIDSIMGEGCGTNLYYQAICPGQFEVYYSGRYLGFMDDTYENSDQAVIDMLYSQNTMHNYLSFKSSNTYVEDSVQFVENGNNYHEVLYDYDLLDNYSR